MNAACPCCGAPCSVRESKKGGLSLHCGACGYQGFARTPKAASGLRAKLTGAPAEKATAPATAKAPGDWLDNL